jgi:hypothetical protein
MILCIMQTKITPNFHKINNKIDKVIEKNLIMCPNKIFVFQINLPLVSTIKTNIV